MDQEIRISVVVDEKGKTLGSLKTELKELKKQLDATTVGTPEAQQLTTQYEGLKRTIKESSPGWNEYNQHIRMARTEKRALRFALVELMEPLKAFGPEVDKVGKSLQHAVGAGLGMSFALGAMGKSMAAAAGPVGIAIGALTLLSEAFGHSEEKIKDSQKALENWKTKMQEAPMEVIQGEIDRMEKYLAESERARKGVSIGGPLSGGITKAASGWIGGLLYPGKSPDEIRGALEFLKGLTVNTAKETDRSVAESALSWNQLIHDTRMKQAERFHSQQQKYAEADRETQYAAIQAGQYLPGGLNMPLGGGSRIPIKGLARAGGVQPVSFGDSVRAQLSIFTKLEGEFRVFGNAVDSAMGAVGNSIANNIRSGFQRAFGEAHSLLEIFASEFASAIVSLTTQAAALFVLRSIPGIGGIFGGVSGPTQMPISGGETTSARQPFVKVVPILSNQGLAVRVEVGDRINRRARIG